MATVLRAADRLLVIEVAGEVRREIRLGRLIIRIILVGVLAGLNPLQFSWKLSGALMIMIRLVPPRVRECVWAISSGRLSGTILWFTLPGTIGIRKARVSCMVVRLVKLPYMLELRTSIGCRVEVSTFVIWAMVLGLGSWLMLARCIGLGVLIGLQKTLTGMLRNVGL